MYCKKMGVILFKVVHTGGDHHTTVPCPDRHVDDDTIDEWVDSDIY